MIKALSPLSFVEANFIREGKPAMAFLESFKKEALILETVMRSLHSIAMLLIIPELPLVQVAVVKLELTFSFFHSFCEEAQIFAF